MERRSGLGRGLGALIPPSVESRPGAVFREIPVASVRPNQNQPRTRFDEEALSSLTASVQELGVLQPILVRTVVYDSVTTDTEPSDVGRAAGEGDETFELIAGERRWRAARRAGLTTIPAIVRGVDDTLSLEQALVENIQREDLNPLDEAAAYRHLIEDFHLTHDQVAVRVGKSRATVTNALRLFQLPAGVQRLVLEGRLSAGHARAVLSTPDRAHQEDLARQAVEEGLSVREVEQRARRGPSTRRPGTETVPAPSRSRQAPILELENLLASRLDTRVQIEMATRSRPGRVVIDFADLDDLERIYRVMATPETGRS